MDVCLTMIVKDEAAVIARCIASVKPIITRWCILDTGSTDETEVKAREAMGVLPGEYHHVPWRGFGASRTEAFELARINAKPDEYALVIDADDVLTYPNGQTPDLRKHPGGADAYLLPVNLNALRYERPHLFRLDKPWRYEGVLHEYATCEGSPIITRIEGIAYECHRDGARSTSADTGKGKYERDALTLMRALQDEPLNARYVFYAAQSWRDAEDDERALKLYQRRAAMAGFEEEVFVSLLEIGRASERLGRAEPEIWAAYLAAYARRPTRGAEPLCELARFCRLKERHEMAWMFASTGIHVPYPSADRLFISSEIYSWRMQDEYAMAAYYTGRKEISAQINEALLANEDLPQDQRPRIENNLSWALHGRPITKAPS